VRENGRERGKRRVCERESEKEWEREERSVCVREKEVRAEVCACARSVRETAKRTIFNRAHFKNGSSDVDKLKMRDRKKHLMLVFLNLFDLITIL